MSKTIGILNKIKNYVTEYRITRVEYIVELCDEAIAELEEQEDNSCEGCKHIHQGWWCNENGIKVTLDFCCNRYEPKATK